MDLDRHIVDGHLRVRVRPSRPKTLLAGYDDSRKAVKIDIAAPPEDGKANKELLKFLKKDYGLIATIKSGETSREKLLKVEKRRPL